MTRSDSSVCYDPDGIKDRYGVPFPVFSPGDIRAVLVEGPVETPVNGFSVEGFGTEAGVYVRFFTPPPAERKLVLYRWTKRVQETDYPEGGRFPSKTVEEDFDKLTAMAQEEEDFLQTVMRVPRSAAETPAEYLNGFFATAEDAMNARDEARGSAADAASSASSALGSAAQAASDAVRAAKSAENVSEYLAGNAPIGTELHKGVVRLATEEEHETGAAEVAAQPSHVRTMLEASMRKHGALLATGLSGKVDTARYEEDTAAARGAFCPMPKDAAGVGRFLVYQGVAVSSYTLPDGGTWIWWSVSQLLHGGTMYPTGEGGIAAGGTVLAPLDSRGKMILVVMWRIT